jgi:hypothetical protein
MKSRFLFLCAASWLASVSMFAFSGFVRGEDKPAGREIGLAEGKIVFEAPMAWVRKQPKSRIIEHEFAIPVVGEGKEEGRFTVMGAGGGIEANIARWQGQFTQSDGSTTAEKTKTQKLQVNGVEVHYVDISGDYKDSAGPFNPAPAVTRPNYRMLAAIVNSDKLGQYFLKFYGPKDLVAANEKAFQDMVNALKLK